MAETHELRLKIDAAPAQSGAKRFTAAVESVKKAVRDLDRDTTGAFTQLRNISPKVAVTPLTRARTEAERLATATTSAGSASDRAAAQIKRTALASASALRTSEQAAQRLALRMGDLGNTQGLAQLDTALTRLRSDLVGATSSLDVRSAKSQFDNLRSSLLQATVATEYAKGAQAQLTRETEEAARAAATHAAQLDTLARKYNPLYATSKNYESALEEIALAEREGALSAQMAEQARARAASTLSASTTAVDQHTAAMQRGAAATQQGVMVGHQLSDVLITSQMGFQSVGMIALQQGSQLAAQMNSLKAAGGGVFRTLLSGFMSLVNPLSLITIGAVAAGAAVAKWFFAAGEETKAFSDALSDADSRINELRSATNALAGNNLRQLRREYGAVNAELDAHLERLRKVAELEAGMVNTDMIRSIRDALTSDGNPFTTDIDAVRRALDTTSDRARVFLRMMREIENARTFEAQAEAVTRLRAAVESTTGGLDKSEGAAKGVLTQLVRAEDAALRLLAAQNGVTGATDNASGAASNLTYTIGTAADEAARLLMNLNSVPSALAVMGKSVEGQIASIRAQNAALNLQISEGLSAQAANRRVQLQTMISTAGERGQSLNFDQIAAEWKAIEELDAAAQEQTRLRERLSELNRPARKARTGGGGSSRTEQLTDEQKVLESLNDTLAERLTSLEEERRVIGLVASGMFQTEEAAQLYAKAQTAMGGSVDEATANMIRQIDAAQQLNEALKEAARDPLKEWQKSVPSYQKLGNDIEAALIGSVQSGLEGLMTGDFSFEDFGNQLLSQVASIVAPKATEELFGLTGLDQLIGGVGDWTARLGGDGAQIATGGAQAGQTISAAMVQAGQQVSQQIAQTMTTGGTSAQTALQSGMVAGGSQVAQQQRLAGIATGQQVRTASTQGGQALAQGVVQGAQTGAPILGAAVASGGATGGAGGSILSAMGGWGGIATAVLGAFEEGGISTAPVGMASMPLSSFHNAPHFSQGTPNTSGIPAVLHPNEAVIPLSKGRKVPVEMGGESVGGRVFNQTINQTITTPDADSFRKSKKQIANELHRAGSSAARSLS